ncbi:MAG: lecithin retinol acyltransferase family protein [Acidimicrobiales bacterium]
MTASPGAHVRVRRRCGYWHHGIYVADNRVIQFGGQIRDKRRATVEVVTLKDFAQSAKVEVVVHSPGVHIFGPVGPPGIPEEIVHRAEWLLANHPKGRYNLVGWNCETAATFCVNGFRESSQVRRIFVALWLSALPLVAALFAAKKPPRWLLIPIWSLFSLIFSSIWAYKYFGERIWLDLEDQWLADHPE